MAQWNDGEALVHQFLAQHVQHLRHLDAEERNSLLDAVRELGSAWCAHRAASTEQDRTRALREVDAAMAEIDLVAERVVAAHSDRELAKALRQLQA